MTTRLIVNRPFCREKISDVSLRNVSARALMSGLGASMVGGFYVRGGSLIYKDLLGKSLFIKTTLARGVAGMVLAITALKY
ncbi:MAG: hypothetical protein JSS09_08935 [Verrucomicrobia bacterium]|nr:hypothetical protein [Verrucomicrobiota bacterium]